MADAMTADELKAAGEALYGERWRRALCAVMDIDLATLRRWTSGKKLVPGPAALAVRLMLKLREMELQQCQS